jgi:hypothetical protein
VSGSNKDSEARAERQTVPSVRRPESEFIGFLKAVATAAAWIAILYGLYWFLTVTGLGDLIADALEWFTGDAGGDPLPADVDQCVVSGHC